MKYLIEHTSGERQVIETEGDPLDGYGEGWTLIASDIPPPPEEGEWDGAQWIQNQARLDEKAELAEVTDRQRLRQALKAARNRIVTLENRQTQLIAAVQDLQARVEALEATP